LLKSFSDYNATSVFLESQISEYVFFILVKCLWLSECVDKAIQILDAIISDYTKTDEISKHIFMTLIELNDRMTTTQRTKSVKLIAKTKRKWGFLKLDPDQLAGLLCTNMSTLNFPE
jgi:hypothetical protein